MYIIVEPSSKEEFYDYYRLRWLLLRRPLGGRRGSELDHMENLSIHRMIKDNKGDCIGVGRIQLLTKEAQIRYMAILKKYQKKGLGSKLIKELEESIDRRRNETRESLLMFGPQEDVAKVSRRIVEELKALDDVAAAAGEPTIDADFVALVMAMDLEQIEEDPRHGGNSRQARREAEQQLDSIKSHLAEREKAFLAERTFLLEQRDIMK